MQPDRFTIKSQEALATAARLAQERPNPQVVPAHLLAALLEGAGGSETSAGAAGGVVLPVLAKLGVEMGALRAEVERALEELPKLSASSTPARHAALRRTQLRPARRQRTRRARCPTSTSRQSTCCWHSPARVDGPARLCAPSAPAPSGCSRRWPRSAARTT